MIYMICNMVAVGLFIYLWHNTKTPCNLDHVKYLCPYYARGDIRVVFVYSSCISCLGSLMYLLFFTSIPVYF